MNSVPACQRIDAIAFLVHSILIVDLPFHQHSVGGVEPRLNGTADPPLQQRLDEAAGRIALMEFS